MDLGRKTMKRGHYTIVHLLTLSLTIGATQLSCAQKTDHTNMTRDWLHASKAALRKKQRAQCRKALFSSSEKNNERVRIHQEKKSKAAGEQRKKIEQTTASHICIARIHHKQAETLYKDIVRLKKELEQVERAIRKFKGREAQRAANTSKELRHAALIASRHAQTTADQEQKDYECARIHNRVTHPELVRLRQQAADLRFKIKLEYRELRSLRSASATHYEKAGDATYLRNVQRRLRDHAIIAGKAPKRTRIRFNESQAEYAHKQKIEKLRKRAVIQRQKERARNRKLHLQERRHKKHRQQKRTHLSVLVQKKQK